MDAALKASLSSAIIRPFYCVKIALSAGDVCLTTSPAFSMDGDDFTDLDPVYGVLDTVSGVKDSIDGQVPQPQISLMPSTEAGRINLQAFTAQGARVQIWWGNWNYTAGVPFGVPKQEFIGLLDRPEQGVNPETKTLVIHCITTAARAFEASDHRRLSDPYHQQAHPGERGLENMPMLDRDYWWRMNEPNGGRGNPSGGGGGAGGRPGGTDLKAY